MRYMSKFLRAEEEHGDDNLDEYGDGSLQLKDAGVKKFNNEK